MDHLTTREPVGDLRSACEPELSRSQRANARYARALALHDSGDTYGEIARAFGVTSERARQLVAEGSYQRRARSDLDALDQLPLASAPLKLLKCAGVESIPDLIARLDALRAGDLRIHMIGSDRIRQICEAVERYLATNTGSAAASARIASGSPVASR